MVKLEKLNQQLLEKHSSLEQHFTNLQTACKEHNQKFLTHHENKQSEEMHEMASDDFQTLSNRVKIIERTLEKQNSFVSFTAYATESKDYNLNDLVQFPEVGINYGGYYLPQNSTFICPYTGYYMFSVSFRSAEERIMGAGIRVGNDDLVTTIARDPGTFDVASTMAVSLCEEGEQVWIRSLADGYRMYGYYNSFHGTLLRIL